jgi:hypothetical protein
MGPRALLAVAFFSGIFMPAPPLFGPPDKAVSTLRNCGSQAEETNIYSTYLRREASKNALTLLVTTTEGYIRDTDSLWLGLAAEGHAIPPGVRADFISKNRSGCIIQPFDDLPNLRFISRSEERRIFAAGPNAFRKKYGEGSEVLAFSRVGFNSDKTLALLHVLGAYDGELYLFERKHGSWVTKFYIQTKAT